MSKTEVGDELEGTVLVMAIANPVIAMKQNLSIGFLHPIPLVLLAALLVSFAIDIPVAAFCKARGAPRFVDEILENVEPFGHGVGATLILLGVFVLDRSRRNRFLYLLGGSLGAGLVANLVKLTIVRSRPRTLGVLPENVWATFGDFFSREQRNATQSFPSAHTATAVGLAMMLSFFYPHGRWYFTGLAILVGMQRIHCEAHFPSDVFAGAIIGWLVAMGCQASMTITANRQTNITARDAG